MYRNHVMICGGTGCTSSGSDRIAAAVERALERHGLDSEVKDHEPRMALDGGRDGLDFYRRIAAEAPSYLEDGGYLLLETGDGQAEAVAAMLRGFRTKIVRDLEGKERMIAARLCGRN